MRLIGERERWLRGAGRAGGNVRRTCLGAAVVLWIEAAAELELACLE